MQLYHTSPEEIKEINKDGRFGQFLFFSSEKYVMTAASDHVTYLLDLDEDQAIEVNSFFYREDSELLNEIVEEIQYIANCDEETAQNLLDASDSIWNLDSVDDEDKADIDFDIQKLQGQAAKALGFRAAETADEQGTVWIVDMLNREKDLIKI